MRQYRYDEAIGRFVDQWNGDRVLNSTQDLAALGDLDTAAQAVLDVCGCVSDVLAAEMHAYLSAVVDGVRWDGPWAIACIADDHELTEHGGSIAYPWVTDAGREWLRLWREDAA